MSFAALRAQTWRRRGPWRSRVDAYEEPQRMLFTPADLGLRAWYDAELGQPKNVGYVQLDGVAGDFISTPDAPNLDIAGDLEVVMRVKATDWSLAANQTLVSKYVTTGNQRSFRVSFDTFGRLVAFVSPDGTTATQLGAAIPTVPFVDNTWYWIKVLLDLDDGAGNRVISTFVADGSQLDEPTSWTANGSSSLAGAIAGMYNSTSPIEIGTFANGTLERFAGQVSRCIVRDGIGGRTVADFNAAQCYGPGYLNEGSLPTSGGSAYVPLRGVSGDYIWTADKAALRITGDIEIVARVASSTWSSNENFVTRWGSPGAQAFAFQAISSSVRFFISTDGTNALGALATANHGFTAGTPYWVKVTRRASDGRVQFFTAPDSSSEPSSWTQLGADVTLSAGSSIFAAAAPLELGSQQGGTVTRLSGGVFRAIVRSGIGGTTVADFNAANATAFGLPSDGVGNGWLIADPKHHGNWTLGLPKIYDRSGNGVAPATFGAGSNQPLWLPWQGRPQVYSPAGTNNTVSAPSLAQHDITGDIEIVARVMQVPNGAAMRVVSRTTANTWGLFVNASNLIGASVKIGGVHYYPSVPFGQWFGRPVWVRWTRVAATGENAFYVHPDQAAEPTNWMLLGTSTTGGAGAMDSVAGLGVIVGGYATTGGEPWQGTISKVTVRNGIGGTVAADFDAGLCGPAGYSSPDGSVWTVNRATSGRKTVVQSPVAASARSVILHGTDDSDIMPLAAMPSMAAATPASVLAVDRCWGTVAASSTVFDTRVSNSVVPGLSVRATGETAFAILVDSATTVTTGSVNTAYGKAHLVGAVLDAANVYPVGDSMGAGSARTGNDETGTSTALVNVRPGPVGYLDSELSALISASRALSATELDQLVAYYKCGV